MYRIGLTGGIGSGKSTVCKVFEVLGIPYFSADEYARELVENDIEIIREINNIAGRDLYADGSLDRQALAKLIFNNFDHLSRVNTIVHPKVFSAFMEWSEKQVTPYVIMEAAILYESGGDMYTDEVVAVTAPLEERVMRVTGRSKLSREEILARIDNQINQSVLEGRAKWIIDNSDNRMVIPQVIEVNSAIIETLNRRAENG